MQPLRFLRTLEQLYFAPHAFFAQHHGLFRQLPYVRTFQVLFLLLGLRNPSQLLTGLGLSVHLTGWAEEGAALITTLTIDFVVYLAFTGWLYAAAKFSRGRLSFSTAIALSCYPLFTFRFFYQLALLLFAILPIGTPSSISLWLPPLLVFYGFYQSYHALTVCAGANKKKARFVTLFFPFFVLPLVLLGLGFVFGGYYLYNYITVH